MSFPVHETQRVRQFDRRAEVVICDRAVLYVGCLYLVARARNFGLKADQ